MRTWFITGASRGLGRAFVEAALPFGALIAGPLTAVIAVTDDTPWG